MLTGTIRKAGPCLAAGLCLAVAAGASAQSGPRRVYEEQLRVRMDRQAPAEKLGFDGGGWLDLALYDYDDEEGRTQRTLREFALRLWGSASLDRTHRFYVRGASRYMDWNSGTNPAGRGDDFEDPDLERAWYALDATRLMGSFGVELPFASEVKIGRQWSEIGTGFVLAMPLDALRIDAAWREWDFAALAGMTVDDSLNIDRSLPVRLDSDRCFLGFEAGYRGLAGHRLFGYYLRQEDSTNAVPDISDRQRFDYSSQYLGVGAEGTVWKPELRYWGELVYEYGETFSRGATGDPDDICAMALDVGAEYLLGRHRYRPRVTAEYIYASGDDDRLSSSSATMGGNEPYTDDEAFNAFGYRDTGIAFAPRVSNLHILALGGSALPMPQRRWFEDLEVGAKAFLYAKADSDGPISDTTGNENSAWVGVEWDMYCNWRLTSDLAWTVRYGAFFPGDAFRDSGCRQALITALTYSF